VAPAGKATFVAEFVDEPFGADTFDPEIVHRRHYDDGLYRVIIGESGTNETRLYTTSDFDTFSLVQSDILGGVSGSGQVAGIEVLSDGTRALFSSTDSATDVYSGPDLQNLSLIGRAVPEPDGGSFYDEANGIIHYYPEDADTVSGVSSQKISHWTIPEDDLTNPTQQSDAIDVTGESWKTGDPHIWKMGDWYYMSMDRTSNHPNYYIALATSRDLYNWTINDQNITADNLGGDLTLTRKNGYFEALTEYSNGANTIGHWRLWPRQQDALISHNTVTGFESGTETVAGVDASATGGGWDNTTFNSTTVTFEKEFSTTPKVLVSINDNKDKTYGYQPIATNISSSSFNLSIEDYSSQDHTGETYAADWFAIGVY